jgi:AcrR family transcriptional regulator
MTDSDTKPRWSRLGPEQRRLDILEVARRHFAMQHYEAVSTTEIAREAGVNRGLIHHYFGTKRDLYLEVLKTSFHVPQIPPLGALVSSPDMEATLEREIDTWLGEADRNRATYLASRRGAGFGSDPEVEAIMQAAREQAADVALGVIFEDPSTAPPPVRAAILALGGLLETAVYEWLEQQRLSRDQVRVLVLTTALSLMRNLSEILAAAPLPASR